ncbi:MAG TPA: mycofactocin biosynthesis glycosyltransferase MftF [Baekduia sp.]|nr:mycofactocin biosynthesis glycosyltransferase MftF [Baekduia sp.]
MTAGPPAHLRVRLHPGVLVRDRGRLLCGGTPFRLIRLSAAGAAVVARWRLGGPVGVAPADRVLASQLLDGGLLLTDPEPASDVTGMTLVVPVRDRVHQVRRCLAALAKCHPGAQIVVVDDGSKCAEAVRALATEHGAIVVRHDVSAGPGAARNAGLAATRTELVAFIDSDVVVDAGCLPRLAAHFDDPAVGAAAPRVLAFAPRATGLAGFETDGSSLDMGRQPAAVGPGRWVPYVPSTALVVRRIAVRDGYDESLRVGEDVDLIWRMIDEGWRVAYDPVATVRHDHRVQPRAFARRRLAYAHSVGPLARRHPAALPAVRLEPWSAAIVLLGVAGCPAAAVTLFGARVAVLRRRLRGRADRPTVLASELVGRATVGTAHGLGHAVRRVWSPLLLVAAPRSALVRRSVLGAIGLRAIGPGRHELRRLPFVLADDALAAVGTWAGCATARTARPLLPAGPRYRGQPQGSP